MLSFGYTLLHNDLHGACNVVGFDPYVGYLHADRYGRANLPLDLMEEFRPIVIDSVVLTCINKRIFSRMILMWNSGEHIGSARCPSAFPPAV